MKPVVHGGDLGDVQRRFPDAPTPWIDLSTGINPVPYPLPVFAPENWARLPTRAQYDRLIAAAAARYGVHDSASVVPAPGTQALIQLLPRMFPKGRVAVIGPTYEEHEVSWRRQGHDVRIVASLDAASDADIVVVVNPDNPTGRLIDPNDLRAATRGWLIVDEAFIDFNPPAASLAINLPPRTIVLRSFGKSYGLAGVRLGFAIAETSIARRLRDELGPWAVSGPALEIGRLALADSSWLNAARRRLEADRQRLDELLAGAGFDLVGGTTLFRLARHGEARAITDGLAHNGIHVRAFPHEPCWLRFGMPGSDPDFARLRDALERLRLGRYIA